MRELRIMLPLALLVLPIALRCPELSADESQREEQADAERAEGLKRAHDLNTELVALYRKGKYREAASAGRTALALREKWLGPKHLDVAKSLSNLAEVLRTQGHYGEAYPFGERALRIREAVLGPEHQDVARSLTNLAALLQQMGAYEDARPLCERALRIWEKVLGPDHPDVARCIDNMALLLKEQGTYQEAERLLKRALAIWEKALGPEHPAVATNLNNLALVLKARGALAEARPLYERALTIKEAALGPEHPQVGTALNNLAMLLKQQGAYEEAAVLLRRALAIWEMALGAEHPALASGLSNLALLLTEQGAYENAAPLLLRSVKIGEKALGREHPVVARGLGNLALVLLELGAYDKAGPLFEQVPKILEEALGPEHPDVAQSLSNLARFLELRGVYDEARPLRERSLSVAEQNVRRNLAGGHGSRRLALMRHLRDYLDRWLQLVPHLDRSGYAEVLRFKGLVARASTAERRLVRLTGAESAEGVHALRAAERRLSKLTNAMPSLLDKKRLTTWQQNYATAAAEREVLAVALARNFAPLRAGLERLDLSLPDIQAHLAVGDVLLDYLRTADSYLVWVIQPTGGAVRIDLGRADVLEAAALELAEHAGTSEDEEARIRAGRVLRDLILTPVEEHLGKHTRTLYLCPDAALAVVPFAALPGKTNDRLLTDDYRLACVSMAQELVPWKDAPTPGRGALLLGGVDYGRMSEDEDGASGPSPESNAPAVRAARRRTFSILPGTVAEVELIGNRLGKDSTALLGARATETRLRTGAPGKRILHLATHGYVRDDLMRGLQRGGGDLQWLGADMERQLAAGYDPMLLAGLALAGANRGNGANSDDGILTASEASHLDLDGVDLVVLSACQTALGRATSGEGVIGLVQGFQLAGAKDVIGSLWKVDDKATRLLMERFYELWSPKGKRSGLPATKALRQAQAHVRSTKGYEHPYYWAAWVLWTRS